MTNIQTESKKRLRIVREWLQMSQAQLAKELHMNTEAYRRIEVGKVNIPIEILYELENKFEQQEARIDRLEMKLEKILSTLEEKDDMVLNRKVDKIEKMLSRLGTNIEKLTSYVDED